LKVKAWDFFTKVLKGGDLAFGEAFIAGDWETSNLAETLKLFTANWESVVEAHPWTTRWGGFFDLLFHWSRKNSPSGSRRNIRSHYDLSNAFFQTFLDDSLTYSSAVYENPGQSLEQAQRHKIRMLLEKARLKPADHLLEIGSGWGTLAMEAARQTGCRVTTITISEEQFRLASRRVREAGLQDRVEVQLRDYRRLTGRYDRILSVEMLEAVGHEHYGTYFAACDRLLKPGGLAVIQVITMPDQRYEGYRKRCDFIQKHIFPGAVIPSLKALNDAMTRHSQLMIEDMENIGPHYARTLADWTQRFREQKEAIEKLGFDGAFQRKWLYYFAYCEAGFDLRVLNNLQLVLTRPGNPNLPTAGGAVNHPARQDRAEKQNMRRL
jgi:cyclopropane-fatty-acyl-phospholipid synthase